MGKVIYERRKGEPLPEGYIDGMVAEIEEDDFQPTEFVAGENPPIGFWGGTHTRDGKRVPGFTEAEYTRGEASGGTLRKDADGNPVYA